MKNGSRTRTTKIAAAAVTGALVLAACGSDAEEAADDPSPSVSASPSPSSTVAVPGGVELTEVGADLAFGDTATVIHEPDQKTGTVLELTVKRATLGSLQDFSGFVLDPYTKSSTPYYVDVAVENVGEGQVGGSGVPLWGVDATNTLLPAARFTTTFRRCPSEPLPKTFGPGRSFETCLVFLAPDKGTLEAASFRPNQEFDPIRWTGEIATPKPKPKKDRKDDRKKDRKKDRKRDRG